MIDLKLSESELKTYARKYAHLLPELSPQLINRMAYEHRPMPDEKPKKPEWMNTLKQHISDIEALDKAKGLLMGLAVGDAVGTTLEFQIRDSSNIYDMVGGGPFNLKAGEWTDDTSMALCLAETYIEKNCCDIDFFREKLISWYKTVIIVPMEFALILVMLPAMLLSKSSSMGLIGWATTLLKRQAMLH